ncbi:MAG: holo-ACP synthase [Aquabacterium sp.]
MTAPQPPTPPLPAFPALAGSALAVLPCGPTGALGVGMDVVDIARVHESMSNFGARFIERIFTADEAAYAALTPALQAEKLAARFAAKEAALKALGMADQGVPWTDMEVFRHADGRCDLHLHGKAAEHAQRRGVVQIALSLSHDGPFAAAIVVAVFHEEGGCASSPQRP